MNPKALLAFLLMLAPTVYGCINFQAGYVSNSGGGAYPLSAQLWDNGAQSDPPTCTMNGYKSNDGLYHFTCFENDYAATFDDTNFDGITQYSRPGQSFSFLVPPSMSSKWATCVYGCAAGQCFVPTSP